MTDSEDSIDLYLAASAMLVTTSVILTKKKKKRKIWTRNWLRRKEEKKTVLHMLNDELLVEDPAFYKIFLRMSNPLFEYLLNIIEGSIRKQDTVMRDSIPARSRLEVTLRFLATGETFRSLMYSTRIHETTLSRFVPEVCEAIYEYLKNAYLKVGNIQQEWDNIANRFYELWDFPNCLGALDGKHIKFRAPVSAGSFYHNYKGEHSIVFLGLADAEYKFTYVNVEFNGRISDGGVLRESTLSQAISDNSLNFPPSKPLPGRSVKVPYVIVADDAFPLKERIMKPYSQTGISHNHRIFNYRLSRARRIVENSFGILANRFRILLNPINLSVNKVELITLCCIVLHNCILSKNKESYCDMGSEDGNTISHLEKINLSNSNRTSKEARDIRDEFTEFFNTTVAREWQELQVARSNM